MSDVNYSRRKDDKDLGEVIDNLENNVEDLKHKEFRLFGMKMTIMTISLAISGLATVIGMLYGGFTLYQQVEELATLDIGAYQQEMKVMSNKVDEAIDYSRSIKNDLRDDFNRMEKNVDRVEQKQRDNDDKVKEMIDRASERFDTKRESLQTDTNIKIRSMEDRLNKKIQLALDNPLAN